MRFLQFGASAFVLGLAVAPALAVITGTTRIATGTGATFAAADPTDPNRLLLTTFGGDITVLDLASGTVSPTPFLTVPDVDNLNSEGGVLGIALHPDYATNGLGYIYYTTAGGAFGAGVSRVASFQRDPANPTQALAGSLTQLLAFDQPQGNHNAGWMGFGPNDGYLYIASGDGGGGNDNGDGHTLGVGNGQDITDNLLGAMLRIDVNGDDFPADPDRNFAIPASNPFVGIEGDDEIWAYGLRNPWRNSFDRETGDLWIADVGQEVLEELNFQPASSAGGENYGWRLREGTIATPTPAIDPVGGSKPPGAVDPFYEYPHGSGDFEGFSITGGYVYRGPDPDLQGQYLFGDFQSGNHWLLDPSDPMAIDNIDVELFDNENHGLKPISFFEDSIGNLYMLDIFGAIFRIETTPAGDYDNDGDVDTNDYDLWESSFGSTTNLLADGNSNGVVDAADYTVWRDQFVAAATIPEPAGLLAAATLLGLTAPTASRRSGRSSHRR